MDILAIAVCSLLGLSSATVDIDEHPLVPVTTFEELVGARMMLPTPTNDEVVAYTIHDITCVRRDGEVFIRDLVASLDDGTEFVRSVPPLPQDESVTMIRDLFVGTVIISPSDHRRSFSESQAHFAEKLTSTDAALLRGTPGEREPAEGRGQLVLQEIEEITFAVDDNNLLVTDVMQARILTGDRAGEVFTAGSFASLKCRYVTVPYCFRIYPACVTCPGPPCSCTTGLNSACFKATFTPCLNMSCLLPQDCELPFACVCT